MVKGIWILGTIKRGTGRRPLTSYKNWFDMKVNSKDLEMWNHL